jgi:hypothetical protein
MALTIVAFAVIQIVMPTMVRPRLRPPVTTELAITADTIANLAGPRAFLGEGGEIGGLNIPDAWLISNTRVRTANGGPVDLDRYDECVGLALRENEAATPCLADLDLHVDVAYQSGERYWSYQWLEAAIFAALSGLLAGFGLWHIQRRLP